MLLDTSQRSVIGIGGLAVRQGDGVIVTHALGSCLGIVLWCPATQAAGMLHAQLPMAAQHPERARDNLHLFVDAGTQALIQQVVARGANRRTLQVYVAGAANLTGAAENDLFNIGKRNLTVMRKVFFQLGLLITAEETGGTIPRTMTLEVATGKVVLSSQGTERVLSK